MTKLFYHKFKVRPRGKMVTSFPIDMMRYDGCFPAHESESSKIERTFGRFGAVEIEAEDAVIEMAAYRHKDWKPQDARRDSFIWQVVPLSHEVLPV